MENSEGTTPQHPRIMVSPATSTPGQSPGGLLSTPPITPMRPAGHLSTPPITPMGPAGSQDSEDSNIDTSVTLNISNEITAYEKDEDDTTIMTTGLGSCVAERTRSKDAIRQEINLNISQITENITREIQLINLEDSKDEDIPEHKAMDSINLPKYKRMLDTVNNLDASLSTMAKLEDRFEDEKVLDKCTKKALVIIERGRGISFPEEAGQEIELMNQEDRNYTFVVNRPGYETAMAEVIRALELLAEIDLKSIPAKNLESIVGLLLAICRDYNTRVQGLYDTINTITEYVQKFMILGQKAYELDVYKKRLEREKYKIIEENSNLKDDIINLQKTLAEYRNKEEETTTNEDEKDRKLKDNEKEIEDLKVLLRDMHVRKEMYKENYKTEKKSLDESMKQIEEEQDKARKADKKHTDDIANAEVRTVSAEQEARDRDDAYRLLENKIELEREERQRQVENNERAYKKIDDELKVLKEEINRKDRLLISTRKALNQELRSRDVTIIDQNKKLEDQNKKLEVADKIIKEKENKLIRWQNYYDIYKKTEECVGEYIPEDLSEEKKGSKTDSYEPQKIDQRPPTATQVAEDSSELDSSASIDPLSRNTTRGNYGDTTTSISDRDSNSGSGSVISVKRRREREKDHTQGNLEDQEGLEKLEILVEEIALQIVINQIEEKQ